MHREDLDNLEEIIGYKFKNRELLVQALTHSSYANELKMNRKGDYQRMEFLGDAVLELVASEELYDKSPGMTEGELSKKRSSMVCEPALATCTRAIGLQEFVRLGKGEEMSQGRQRDSIASDVMEALIGAIFLDDGFDSAAVFVRKAVMGKLENKKVFRDSKSMLQEYVQQRSVDVPEYRVIKQSGPDHARKYECAVFIGNKLMGRGTGTSKKAGEQAAAHEALEKLKKNNK